MRQKFTGYERDGETGLDFAQARYYSNTQARFTSVDPENAGVNPSDPQSWNGYAYARSNPLLYTDPDGQKYLICKDGECYEHTDEEFKNLKKNSGGLTLTGNGNFYERGNILDGEGNVVGQYAQTSIDNLEHRAIATIAGAVAPVPKAFAYLYGGSVLAGTGLGGVLYAAGGAGTVTTLGLTGAATEGTSTAAATVAPQAASAIGNALKGFTKHGINQAISRDGVGVSSKAILDALKNPVKVVVQKGGEVKIIGKDATVILNQAGKVITTWARNSAGTRIQP